MNKSLAQILKLSAIFEAGIELHVVWLWKPKKSSEFIKTYLFY